MVRTPEYSDAQIIEAGLAIRSRGGKVTGSRLRQRLTGGNPLRLAKIWIEFEEREWSEERDTFRASLQPKILKLMEDYSERIESETETFVKQVIAHSKKASEQRIAEAQHEAETLRAELDQVRLERDRALKQAAKQAGQIEVLEKMLLSRSGPAA